MILIKMINRAQLWLILSTWILISPSTSNAETDEVRNALALFMKTISLGNAEANWGWNATSDPCNDGWKGITCYNNTPTVRKIVLDDLNLTGTIDAAALCAAASLTVLSLNSNRVAGPLPEDISKCRKLTHIYLHGNSLSGSLPASLSRLNNLKRFDVSGNGFSGGIPDFSRISGLLTFLAQNNRLNGSMPNFDFSNLDDFNVSNNDLSGAIPDGGGGFNASRFSGNPRLCGPPLPNTCPPPPRKKSASSKKDYFIYSGYALIGVIVVLLVAFKVMKKTTRREKGEAAAKKGFEGHSKVSGSSSELKSSGENRSEFSITPERGRNSSSLTVLSSPLRNDLKFEDLLQSPAELISRARHGSLYKVTLDGGVNLVVKRIRNWEIGRDEFTKRMKRIDEVRHPNVMPIVAFYCSMQEKLLVYHFQENGSLFNLLHGGGNGGKFEWRSRLNMAAKIAEALAFMQQGLKGEGIAHGNLKSSNILVSKESMDPLISEYGLAEVESGNDGSSTLERDVSRVGVVLLELLTGKVVQTNGMELARWVNSAIREEWTVEVFDKALVVEGASEERMLLLLQLALRCINASPQLRPTIQEVAQLISSIKEQEEERSASFESL
ncbi:probable inactive receptor kinase At2g26730 [Salvia miltiorrhiza]|uniref:probable inactive receptor kinase At2g26730 n=1 Tax=Salvia miltiorrhiza TaxID=226208 RepID=UPI0025ABF425|nr:probable inactive receptor kinase At2g26730 [Salvia miltiorrhiza]